MSLEDYVNEVNGARRYGDFDNYLIGPMIAEGGFSRVHSVTSMGRTFAMKVPKMVSASSDDTVGPMDSKVLMNCKREAGNWAHLSETVPDSVVRMLDYNLVPFPWIVMEMASCDYRSAMDQGSATPSEVVLLLRSLGRIHAEHIVHRDIKPANILRIGNRWKFTDFGLSMSMVSCDDYSRGEGTCGYMPPEAFRDRYGEVDYRSDIWQMGILLFEVLTGHLPYADQFHSTVLAAMDSDALDFSDVPPTYLPVLNKALSVNKAERYHDCDEFADALESVVRSSMRAPRQESAHEHVEHSDRVPDTVDRESDERAHVSPSLAFTQGMGRMKNLGLAPDQESAYRYFSGAHDMPSMLMAAVMKHEGWGTSKDILSSTVEFRRLGDWRQLERCDNGDMVWAVSNVYRTGMDGKADSNRAINLLKTSAELGSCLGQYSLYRMDQEDPENLLKLYLSSEQKYAPAVYLLGKAYETGKTGQPDPVKAQELYDRARKMGYRPPKDRDNAGKQTAAPAKHPSQSLKPEQAPKPKPVPKPKSDRERAEELFQEGLKYEHGRGVPKDLQKALTLYRQAQELGAPFAVYRIREIDDTYRESNWYADYLQRVGHPEQKSNPVKKESTPVRKTDTPVKRGQSEPAPSEPRKEQPKNQAKEGTDSLHKGMKVFNTAQNYELGKGVPKDPQKALELYMEAYDLGYAPAERSYNNLYQNLHATPQKQTFMDILKGMQRSSQSVRDVPATRPQPLAQSRDRTYNRQECSHPGHRPFHADLACPSGMIELNQKSFVFEFPLLVYEDGVPVRFEGYRKGSVDNRTVGRIRLDSREITYTLRKTFTVRNIYVDLPNETLTIPVASKGRNIKKVEELIKMYDFLYKPY